MQQLLRFQWMGERKDSFVNAKFTGKQNGLGWMTGVRMDWIMVRREMIGEEVIGTNALEKTFLFNYYQVFGRSSFVSSK